MLREIRQSSDAAGKSDRDVSSRRDIEYHTSQRFAHCRFRFYGRSRRRSPLLLSRPAARTAGEKIRRRRVKRPPPADERAVQLFYTKRSPGPARSYVYRRVVRRAPRVGSWFSNTGRKYRKIAPIPGRWTELIFFYFLRKVKHTHTAVVWVYRPF